MNDFGDRLKEAREICKLTQRELAIMCDTDDEAIIRGYEKERRAPSKSVMLRLFNAPKTVPNIFFKMNRHLTRIRIKICFLPIYRS